MASFRLTNDARAIIVRRAVDAAFDPRAAALKDREDALARRCYDAVFPAAEQKAAARLPKNWLRHDKCLNFNVGGMHARLSVKGDGLAVPYETRDGTSRGWSCHTRLGMVVDPDLVQDVTTFLSDEEALRAGRKEALAATRALLDGVTTIKALSEVWPEGRSFYESFMVDKPAANLPAPQIASLNAILGLAEPA